MHAMGTEGFDMTGGSDPWYMKRVIDYILAQNAHLVVDADRFYPIGGINSTSVVFMDTSDWCHDPATTPR